MGYIRLLLEVEGNKEEWQFITDIQTLTLKKNVDSGRISTLTAGFHSFPILKEMCKLETMCNLPRVVLLEQLLSR